MSALEQEIASQPQMWRTAAAMGAEAREALPAAGARIAVVGCGTSWFMAQSVAALREAAGLAQRRHRLGHEPGGAAAHHGDPRAGGGQRLACLCAHGGRGAPHLRLRGDLLFKCAHLSALYVRYAQIATSLELGGVWSCDGRS